MNPPPAQDGAPTGQKVSHFRFTEDLRHVSSVVIGASIQDTDEALLHQIVSTRVFEQTIESPHRFRLLVREVFQQLRTEIGLREEAFSQ